MWTISEIADKIMKYSSPQISRQNDENYEDIELPEKYFQKQPNDFTNNKIYLSNQFMNNVFHASISLDVSKFRFEMK